MPYYQISGLVGFSNPNNSNAPWVIPKGTVFVGHVGESRVGGEELVFADGIPDVLFEGWRTRDQVVEIDEGTYEAACDAGRGLAGELKRLRSLGKPRTGSP